MRDARNSARVANADPSLLWPALQKATGDAAAPAVPDFKSLASMGGGRAPAPHPVSSGQHMGSESVPVNEVCLACVARVRW